MRSVLLRASGDEDEDMLPGQPWPGPDDQPMPDGSAPKGDGKHRK